MAIRLEIKSESENRFWDKVAIESEDSCWLWMAAKNEKGYGVFSIGSSSDKAHRIAWMLLVGPIPEKMFICHSCDTPKCVNTSHLFVGTNQDNVDDMIKKNRNSRPPNMAGWNKKYISEELMRMLGKYADTVIAKIAKVDKSVVRRIRIENGIAALPSQTRFKKGDPHPCWSRKTGG